MPEHSRVDWTTVIIAALSPFGPAMVVGTLGISLPEIRTTLGLSEVQGGTLFSAIFVVAACASAAAGRLSDTLGRKVVLVWGGLFLGAGFGFVSAADRYSVALVFLATCGLGYGFITATVFSVMSDLLPGRRGLATGLVSSAYGLGGLAAPLGAAFALQRVGWHGALLAVSFLAVTISLSQWILIKDPPSTSAQEERVQGAGGSMASFVNRNIAVLALAQLFGGSVFWITSSWTPTFLRTVGNLSLEQTGWVMATWGATPIVGSMLLGMLSDRLPRRAVIVCTAYPGALIALAVYGWLSSPVALALGLLLLGLCKSPVPALVVALAQDNAPRGRVGAASGVIMSMHYIAALSAPVLAAQLISLLGNMTTAMIIASTLPFFVFGTLVATVRERRP